MQTAPRGNLKETFIVGGLASLGLLIISWPAFHYFFFAETFGALAIYDRHGGNSIQVAFGLLNCRFFRPLLYLGDLWSNFLLPVDQTVYHLRNFILCVINLLLFHRILLRFVQSRWARVIALGLFAASKIHFTTIGYMNVVEAAILLMTILLTTLFWLRYIERQRAFDYVLAIIFCASTVYAKDNGFLILGIIVSIIPALAISAAPLRPQIRYWAIRALPFVIICVSYFGIRELLAGQFSPLDRSYRLFLVGAAALKHLAASFAILGNFSLTETNVVGHPGISGVLFGDSFAIEFVLCAALWIFIAYTVWRARGAGWLLLVPAVWIILYSLPFFFIRNHQIYYYQEALVGTVVLIGICLDRVRPLQLGIWAVVLVLVAVNAFISNRRSYVNWQYCADRAESIKPIVETLKSNPPELIMLVAPPTTEQFWRFTVGGDMIPYLLNSPKTRVKVVESHAPLEPGAAVYYLPE